MTESVVCNYLGIQESTPHGNRWVESLVRLGVIMRCRSQGVVGGMDPSFSRDERVSHIDINAGQSTKRDRVRVAVGSGREK